LDDGRHVKGSTVAKDALLVVGIIGVFILLTSCTSRDPLDPSDWSADHAIASGSLDPVKALEVQADLEERQTLIRWTTALFAVVILGLFLPSILFSRVEACIAFAGALSFYSLATWARSSAHLMGYVLPIVAVSITMTAIARAVMRTVRHRRPPTAIPPTKPAPVEELHAR